MNICVDTTVLIDILKDEYPNSQELLYTAISKRETLLAPSVVYAELLPQFQGNTKLLDLFLYEHKISIEALGINAVTIAGLKWMKYLRRKSKIKCPKCKSSLNFKKHFLDDFYIGGYALSKCSAIITRDRGIYKTYFSELKIYSTT